MIDLELILQRAEEENSIIIHGFNGEKYGYNDAIVGISRDGQLVYSIEKLIELTAQQGEMDEMDAIEWLEYNTFSAYLGEKTPIYIYTNTGY